MSDAQYLTCCFSAALSVVFLLSSSLRCNPTSGHQLSGTAEAGTRDERMDTDAHVINLISSPKDNPGARGRIHDNWVIAVHTQLSALVEVATH